MRIRGEVLIKKRACHKSVVEGKSCLPFQECLTTSCEPEKVNRDDEVPSWLDEVSLGNQRPTVILALPCLVKRTNVRCLVFHRLGLLASQVKLKQHCMETYYPSSWGQEI
uniref:Uncharacterized protein n=1 Tax=Phlegmariurus squarrosus TaxID=73615 RepID=H9M8B6_PHLSQ|nr:hypothetical protein HusqMp52 [Phlegmariurus squarrosus]AEV55823.1 hypothetical protein HusqMp52 [Phlegmariurus squarrosus]